ncbi:MULTISPECIES: hypothetical protein [unclassified Roseibium]|uniref:hypothetical protein n=1 Tax=unclassified Roseibium TaxID=2629323 RepID=UPI00273D897C|nr:MULTISPECIES: hypothetical protein [unclassified Roseibium]
MPGIEEAKALNMRLARQIEAYWAKRGFDVTCSQIADRETPESQAWVPGLRSDMVNGLPKPQLRQLPAESVSNADA